MNNLAIEVKNINVKYKFVKSMNIKQELIKMIKRKKETRTKEVWALKNLSFSIKRGSNVGIIGSNGSGKTTLLKTIASIFQPDSGEICVHENSISLLTLGAGFQPELSGYENIYLNGLILGFTKEQIDAKREEIIEFSGIGDFIYSPIRTYSSGMKTRLAFSIACHIEPDILLIDEVLGVGDESFRQKSNEKLKELIDHDRTVIMVSHSLPALQELCDELIWIEKGVLKEYGDTETVLNHYKEYMNNLRRK
ncbi:ABC transporter ATP-binding protein [Clostridium sp. D2Q-11]|uniref:ABC transporter ATP-binding protein n=1 Tax=Anaeromonas frigoriresistens TaxID=2683708 RepID=A0A942Z7W0_9FIRM|nr:ABC transporter ATP-binding protein [Anaeromonas frigoriresistens]MBS4539137.1 ABC transporter ATP-binding protein [Anaeromonas frigoriresistens]